MKIPEYIPTDNLYKFIAIFGLIIFVLAVIYPRKALNELYLHSLELYGQVKILELQSVNLENKLNELGLPTDKGTLEQKEEFKKEAFNLKLKSQELKNANAKNDYLLKQYQSYLKYSYLGMTSGILLMFLGFILWYFKLQLYQDIIIKKEATQ